MSIASALAELEKSAALPEHLAYLERVLAEENERRAQFHRSAGSRPGEFINGRIHLSAVPTEREIEVNSRVLNLLHAFVAKQESGEVRAGNGLVHCQRNDYAPDACFFGAVKAARLVPGLFLWPPPDLAVEVLSPATEENDRKLKFQDYARHGVLEYWIIDPVDELMEQYVLPPGTDSYRLQARLAGDARLTSVVLAGFAAPVRAFFDPEPYRE